MAMSLNKPLKPNKCFVLIASFSLILAISQEDTTSAETQNESTIEGTVASMSRQTFVVTTEDNQLYLFAFNRYTEKPQSIAVGTRARGGLRALPGNRHSLRHKS